MNRRQIFILLTVSVVPVLGAMAGCCCSKGSRAAYPSSPGVVSGCPNCAANGPLPPRFNPNPGSVVPGAPLPGAVVAPPVPGSAPSGSGIQQNAYIAPGPAAGPPSGAGAGVYLDQPIPAGPDGTRSTPGVSSSPEPSRPQTPEPPGVNSGRDREPSPPLPVDIPRFASVKTNVAGGLEPGAEGINWLRKRGYRAVLHLRLPGEDNSALKQQIERGGLRYLSLEVSPQTLSREILDQFNRTVRDESNLPLFVFDKDSTLAGGLWYLHFRMVDKKSDEEARDIVDRLGFHGGDKGAQGTMWIAVQNLWKDLKQ